MEAAAQRPEQKIFLKGSQCFQERVVNAQKILSISCGII
jgi:hypothetical protein